MVGLKEISDQGFCISEGELQHGVIGIGAPIIVAGEVMGAVTLVFSALHGDILNRPGVGMLLREGCIECEEKLNDVALQGDRSKS